MRKLMFIFVLSFLTLFTTYTVANSDKSKLILGSWKDEDSRMEYFRDGTFISNAYTGEKYTGTWSIDGNTLRFQFISPVRGVNVYTIMEMTDSTYKIKLNHADRRIANARRIEPKQQSPVYTTKSSRSYHRRNCPELNSNDLIEFKSSRDADSAGAIPCKHCNQSDVVIVDKKNKEKQSSRIRSDTQIETDSNNEGAYISDLKDGKKHGQETLTLSDGSKYVGELKNNRMHGQGTYTWTDGKKYVGGLEDGKWQGHGTMIWPDGRKYIGKWKDDKKHGQGTMTWPNGDKYTGEWVNDVRNGQGTYIWPNGNKYVGGFKDGKRYGRGTFTWPSGMKYVGEWKDSKSHGQGVVTWPSGKKYVGEFKDNKRHGQGTCIDSKGQKYVGEWKDNKRHGQGTLTYSDGSKYVGEWKDDKKYDSSHDKFVSKNRIKAWPKRKDLFANPFIYEGKIIGLSAEFGKMDSSTSGVFTAGGDNPFPLFIVSNIPKGSFKTSGIYVNLAVEVLGNIEYRIPLLGLMQVPHLKFIDYMLPNK